MISTHQTTIPTFSSCEGAQQPELVDFTKRRRYWLSPDEKMEIITREVGAQCEISYAEIIAKGRLKGVAFARHLSMYLCRNILNETFAKIGAFFDGREQGTVRHGNQRILDEASVSPELSAKLERITMLCKAALIAEESKLK